MPPCRFIWDLSEDTRKILKILIEPPLTHHFPHFTTFLINFVPKLNHVENIHEQTNKVLLPAEFTSLKEKIEFYSE